MRLERYSLGIGDRFGRQGEAQLTAVARAGESGIRVTPVWNKSHREHTIIGTQPADVRREADCAVAALGWTGPYYVDADHVSAANVAPFLDCCDFFTIDVADFTKQTGAPEEIRRFADRHGRFVGALSVPGIAREIRVTNEDLRRIAGRFLPAVREAGRIYRRIESARGRGNFVTEVSMDETDEPQGPAELFFILAGLADEGLPVQTVAPKFTGRFNKGVDYAGDLEAFGREFREDLAVIAFAVSEFGLPDNLKLSVHSGSDKFSIYGSIREAISASGAGLHLKTAGTTWLEELIGLALGGGAGLKTVQDIYTGARARMDALCAPYAAVIEIDPARLPGAEEVSRWTGEAFAAALRHDAACPAYNPDFRQLLHVAYRVAAEMGGTYRAALDAFRDPIGEQVIANLLDRHIARIFPRSAGA